MGRELVILPGATHMIPADDPALFNATVDRIAGLLRTLFRMRAGYAKEHAALEGK
jgi:hypothetical protein